MVSSWESWASLLKVSFFSDAICAASADIARRIVLHQLKTLDHGSLILQDTDGSERVFGAPANDGIRSSEFDVTATPLEKGKLHENRAPAIGLHIHSPSAWRRIVLANDIGLAEAYMLGEISCSDLPAFFRLFINVTTTFPANILSSLTSIITVSLHRLSNTTDQAILNAESHYSLSNAMFAAFLDPTMTYSAPLWLPLSDPGSAMDTLEAAQLRKLHYTIAAARIKAGEHVLEIGTGWGSFAIEAVRKTGCCVTTITASSEQADLARRRVRQAGFEKEIVVLLCDYRHVPLPYGGKRYDKLISIEMIEHVGAEYLDTYFAYVDRYLKVDGGIAVFQCITMPEARYEGYKRRKDFIQRYIFPGGHLPTVSLLVASIDRSSKGRLVVDNIFSVSGHYVKALRLWFVLLQLMEPLSKQDGSPGSLSWNSRALPKSIVLTWRINRRHRFLENWEKAILPALREKKPGMTDTDRDVFKKKYVYYFSYTEAGFATKTLGDVSITVGREGALDLISDIPM